MADEKKKIREFEEATTIYEDDYLAIDGNIGKTRKIKPIKIGATYEIEDGDHEFTLVGSNGYEHTVAIPYDNVSMTQAEYNALTEEEKMDGTARFISDAISTDESELWSRVGRATLETEAQVISNAINELVDKTDETNSDVAELNSSLTTLNSKLARKQASSSLTNVTSGGISTVNINISSQPSQLNLIVGYSISSTGDLIPLQLYVSDANTITVRVRNVVPTTQSGAITVYYL